MHYSSDEIEAMGEGEAAGDWWQSKVIAMGAIDGSEIVRAVLPDGSLGDEFPLEAIIRQTTAGGEAFVGAEFVGATFVGETGCYGVDDMGFVKRAARGVGKGLKKAGKGTAKVAKKSGKYAKKGAMLATAPARQAAYAAAWAAFAPVRLTINRITSGIVKEAAKRGRNITGKEARSNLYASMSRSKNPILRGGVALIKKFGPGTSPRVRLMGSEFVGAELVGAAPAAAGVAALNAALIAAKGMLIKAGVAAATGAALKLTSKALGPGAGEPRPDPMAITLPSEESPDLEAMSITPSDQSIDHALDPDEGDGVSGWEAGCCA